MKRKTRVLLGLLIFILLSSIRLLSTDENDVLLFMACIGSVGLFIVMCSISFRTYNKMKENHKRIGEHKKNYVPVNRYMNKFNFGCTIVMIVTMIAIVCYILFLKDYKYNDIITILALTLSIIDDDVINILYKKFYRYY